MSSFQQEVAEQLQCPVCWETCSLPIFMCVNGHIICAACQPKVHKCSECNVKGRPTLRCMQLEKIAELLKIPCPYKILGCKVSVKKNEMATHLAICKFGVNCRLCKWIGQADDLIYHFDEAHKKSLFKIPCGTSSRIKLPLEMRKGLVLTYNEEYLPFWLDLDLSLPHGAMSATMTLVDNDPDLAIMFYFSLKFASVGSHVRFTYEAPVMGVNDSKKNVTKFMIPYDTTNLNEIDVEVSIRHDVGNIAM